MNEIWAQLIAWTTFLLIAGSCLLLLKYAILKRSTTSWLLLAVLIAFPIAERISERKIEGLVLKAIHENTPVSIGAMDMSPGEATMKYRFTRDLIFAGLVFSTVLIFIKEKKNGCQHEA